LFFFVQFYCSLLQFNVICITLFRNHRRFADFLSNRFYDSPVFDMIYRRNALPSGSELPPAEYRPALPEIPFL